MSKKETATPEVTVRLSAVQNEMERFPPGCRPTPKQQRTPSPSAEMKSASRGSKQPHRASSRPKDTCPETPRPRDPKGPLTSKLTRDPETRGLKSKRGPLSLSGLSPQPPIEGWPVSGGCTSPWPVSGGCKGRRFPVSAPPPAGPGPPPAGPGPPPAGPGPPPCRQPDNISTSPLLLFWGR